MAGDLGEMSGTGVGGGLLDLAMALASGFLLCAWEPCRGYLRRQPPPIPYFTFLAVGVIWWAATAAIMRTLMRACEWSPVCLPTPGDFLGFSADRRHGVNTLFSAILLWFILRLTAERAWSRFLGWEIGDQDMKTRMLEWSRRNLRNLKGWEFEKMIDDADDRKIMVMLTLGNRKVYIGSPNEITRDESGREQWISIVPWKSGYRRAKTGELKLTTDYSWMLQDKTDPEVIGDFAMCIPIREVVSCQFFDQSLYERFQLGGGRAEAKNLSEDSEKGKAPETSGRVAAEARAVNIDNEPRQGANRR